MLCICDECANGEYALAQGSVRKPQHCWPYVFICKKGHKPRWGDLPMVVWHGGQDQGYRKRDCKDFAHKNMLAAD